MGLCDLPIDILLPIVRRACAYVDNGLGLPTKKQLPLLAVCRRLRGVAIPVVYDTVYKKVHTADAVEYYECKRIHTNLDLVSCVGFLHLVRRVSIKIGLEADLLQELDGTVRQLRAARERWDAVRMLRVVVYGRVTRHVDLDAVSCSPQEVAAALATVFPRIQQLTFNNEAQNPAVDRLADCIAAHYADQLQVLHGTRTISIPPGAVFRGLRDVEISYMVRGDRMPLRIDPTELRSLKLPGWPASHSWAGFSADGDESRDIWFPSLQVLDLGTCWEAAAGWTDETKDKGRLHFPALRALKARCKDGMPHALRRSVFPARMDRVTILATAPALLDISNMALPSARHFQLSTEGDIAINPAAVAAVQRILDRARDGDEVELIHHRDSRLLKRPEILALTPLTRLEALVDTSVDTVVEIIRCLPRLSSLDIRLQSAGSTPQGISVPEPGADRLVEPISSTLKCVRISFYHDDQNPEPAVLTLRYLLLAVPSLTAISAYGIPGVLMDSFIDAHADQYPHLARLKINIHANRR